MKLTLVIFLFFTLFHFSYGQNHKIKGIVIDSVEKKNIADAAITLIRYSDSVLESFTRSDVNGHFYLIGKDSSNHFVVIVSYPGYADYVQELYTKYADDIDLHTIYLSTVTHLLEEVVVKQTITSIKIKRDTTEYTADSFHIPQNATVEDLLKKLPGIQVDQNGNITANGKRVTQVLVDGEEFFGDDPTLVTRNLRASLIDEVQLYDKKNEQAAIAGLNDPKRKTTLNFKLKEDKKNGFFGKVSFEGGTKGLHNNELMFNRFNGKEKFAFFTIVSNTGKSGLSSADQGNYGDNYASTSFAVINDPLDNWNGTYSGQGLPLVQTAGAHYNNGWNENKQAINLNYKIFNLYVDGDDVANTKYVLPNNVLTTEQNHNFQNRILRNRINGRYDIIPDSTSSIKISTDNTFSQKETHNRFHTAVFLNDTSKTSEEDRLVSYHTTTNLKGLSALWLKKMKKKGRTFSISLSASDNSIHSYGNLSSISYYYTTSQAIPSQVKITDQYKTNDGEESDVSANIIYTEPLSRYSLLALSSLIHFYSNNSTLNSFTKSANGDYSVLDSMYSNAYRLNAKEQRAGINYIFTRRVIRISLGTDIGGQSFQQTNQMNNLMKRRFASLYPSFSIYYSPNSRTSAAFSYNGITNLPSFQQMQPLQLNTDPLNIFVGNPNLQPSFTNSFGFSLFKFRQSSDLFLDVQYRSINDAISLTNTADTFGRNVFQPININGTRSASGNVSYNIKPGKNGLSLFFSGGFSINRFPGIVNNRLNITNSGVYNTRLGIGKYVEDRYDLSLSYAINYSNTISSILKDVYTDYWGHTININLDIFFSKAIQMHSDVNYMFRKRIEGFKDDPANVMLNGWIGKRLLKDRAIQLKILVHNILDINTLNTRLVTGNYTIQNVYRTIPRYGTLSITWNFTKSISKAK